MFCLFCVLLPLSLFNQDSLNLTPACAEYFQSQMLVPNLEYYKYMVPKKITVENFSWCLSWSSSLTLSCYIVTLLLICCCVICYSSWFFFFWPRHHLWSLFFFPVPSFQSLKIEDKYNTTHWQRWTMTASRHWRLDIIPFWC